MTTELKPCPFCGGEAAEPDANRHTWCTETSCGSDAYLSVEAWNRRALAPHAGDNAEEPEAWIIRCKGWGEELRFTEDGAKELADRLEKICGKTASITPLYTHPCTSTPVVSQNVPDLEDKGGTK